MKRIQADFPFEDYWLYKVWHEKEGRFQANLILISNIKKRTTVSYARYLMSIHLGRFLTKEEHVDHIDENRSNDSIDNLQILSKQENKLKSEKYLAELKPKYIELNCSHCGNSFKYFSRNYRFYTKQGRTNFNCSKTCAYESRKTTEV